MASRGANSCVISRDINISDAVERVRHAFRTTTGQQSPSVRARTYEVHIQGEALCFRPAPPFSRHPAASDRAPVEPFYSDIHGSRVSGAGVAWGTDRFLCVWEDNRNVPLVERGAEHDIYGARVSSAGVNLDLVNIPVCTNAAYQDEPAVAWAGREFFCLWEDARDVPRDLWCARIDAAGNALDGAAGGIPLNSSPRRRLQPCIASRSNGLALVVYTAPETGDFNALPHHRDVRRYGVATHHAGTGPGGHSDNHSVEYLSRPRLRRRPCPPAGWESNLDAPWAQPRGQRGASRLRRRRRHDDLFFPRDRHPAIM